MPDGITESGGDQQQKRPSCALADRSTSSASILCSASPSERPCHDLSSSADQAFQDNARIKERTCNDALDVGWPARHSILMAYVRFILMVSACLWLSGCASGPTGPVLAYPPAPSVRPNGQPKMIPCMIGDPLCTPQT